MLMPHSCCFVGIFFSAWFMTNVSARVSANINIVKAVNIPDSLTGGDAKLIKGVYAVQGRQLEVAGALLHIHPMQLCMGNAMMDNSQANIFVIKLETSTSACLSTLDQVTRSFQLDAAAVILLAADCSNVFDELMRRNVLFSGAVIVVNSVVEEDKLYALMQTGQSAYIRISPSVITVTKSVYSSTPPDSNQQESSLLTLILLSSTASLVVLLFIVVSCLAVGAFVKHSPNAHDDQLKITVAHV